MTRRPRLALPSFASFAPFAFALMLLGGCGGPARRPVEHYVPSPEATGPRGGSVVGSRLKPNWLLDDQTLSVVAVAGLPVEGGKDDYGRPVPVAPGLRHVTLLWTQGSYYAIKDVELQVAPGEQIAFRHERRGDDEVRIWTVDTRTGALHDEPFFVPLRFSGGPGFMPIYVPRVK